MNDDDLLRYSRHILLPEIDIQGQQALLNATVLIVGLGGLGSPVAMYLAAAGIGHLVLADFDRVDVSNLQRQVLHRESGIDDYKVQSAKDGLQHLNSGTRIDTIERQLASDDWLNVVKSVDVVVDCTDNFDTRFALNAACVEAAKPLVSAAAIRFEGQLTVFDFRDAGSPCYRCLYDDQATEDLSCSANGVASPLVGVMGSLQALEVVKVLTGVGDLLTGRLVLFDAKSHQWREFRLNKDPQCQVCAKVKTERC